MRQHQLLVVVHCQQAAHQQPVHYTVRRWQASTQKQLGRPLP